MADESVPAPTLEPVGVFDEVSGLVKTAVAEGQNSLKDKVVRKLADEELVKRADTLLAGIRKFSEFKTELDRIKRDFDKVNKADVFVNELGADGKFARTGKFSDAKVKEIEEATKKTKKATDETNAKLKKLEASLAKALNDADYAALKKMVASGKSDEGAESEEKAIE